MVPPFVPWVKGAHHDDGSYHHDHYRGSGSSEFDTLRQPPGYNYQKPTPAPIYTNPSQPVVYEQSTLSPVFQKPTPPPAPQGYSYQKPQVVLLMSDGSNELPTLYGAPSSPQASSALTPGYIPPGRNNVLRTVLIKNKRKAKEETKMSKGMSDDNVEITKATEKKIVTMNT